MIGGGTRKFQSLIGIQGNSELEKEISKHEKKLFQSLIGIQGNSESSLLESLLYKVFKVQLRQPPLNIAFQP